MCDVQFSTYVDLMVTFELLFQRVLWNSGKVLGGGSTINALMFVRGNRENYDQWAREGAEGWSWNEVFPYFLKLEDNGNLEEMDAGKQNTFNLFRG